MIKRTYLSSHVRLTFLFVLFIVSSCSDNMATSLAAAFRYSPSEPAVEQAVQFTDTSTGGPTSWSWNFNDGTSSTAQSPSHAFAAAGSYSVSLVVGNGSESSSVSHLLNVSQTSGLAASFTFTPGSPAVGEAAHFTDTSAGSPLSWSWDFGDGATSTVQNPGHAYATVGSKTVTLTVANGSGSNSVSRTLNVVPESTSLIPADRRIDWTSTGIPGGIPNRTTISTTLNPGATTAQINSAIASCPSGQVVYLSAGTYSNIGVIHLDRSQVTLRGAGAGNTVINSTASGDTCVASPQLGFSGSVAMSSGYTKGSTSVVMAATPANFAVGNLIQFDQDDDTSLVMATDGPGRNLQFIARITGKSGNTISFEPPFPYTFNASKNPKAAYLDGGPGLTLTGIEDLTLQTSRSMNSLIWLAGSDRCWVKGVELSGGDNIFIWVYGSHQVEVRRCYIHDARGTPNNTDGYGVYLYAGTSNCRVEDNIFTKMAAGILCSRSSGNAILYNHVWQTTFNGFSFQFCALNANHGAHGLMTLWEGNMAEQWQNDAYHGSGSHQTLFRNWIHGLHPTNTSNRKMIDLCRASYYHTVVGNVLGDASWTPAAYEMAGQVDFVSQPSIYRLGYPNMTNNDYAASVAWPSIYGLSYPDAKVKSTLLRHGNYDYFNKATVWDSGISDHNLPASLVYSSKPSYFGSLQWPPIGPDVAGYATKIPAKARWDAFQASGNKADLF